MINEQYMQPKHELKEVMEGLDILYRQVTKNR